MEALPDHITASILACLPARSVLQCRSVCKTWLSIIDEPHFPYLHLDHNRSNSFSYILLPLMRKEAQAYFVNDLHNTSYRSLIDCEKIFFDVPRKNLYFWILGSTNGVVCVVYSIYCRCSKLLHNSFYVCNPALKQHLCLPDYSFPRNQVAHLSFGFGFDAYSKKFKVVLIFVWKKFASQVKYSFEVLVNTVGTATWRSKGSGPRVIIQRKGTAPFINGSLHWMDVTKQIVSFDLRSEEFGTIPSPGSISSYSDRKLELGTFHGLLSLTDCSRCDLIEIWVMKDYNVKESWTKQLAIRIDIHEISSATLIVKPLYSLKKKKLLMLHGAECLYCYDVEGQKHNLLKVACPQSSGGFDAIVKVIPHTPSLFSVTSLSKMEDQ